MTPSCKTCLFFNNDPDMREVAVEEARMDYEDLYDELATLKAMTADEIDDPDLHAEAIKEVEEEIKNGPEAVPEQVGMCVWMPVHVEVDSDHCCAQYEKDPEIKNVH
jgi:hypothetical protein